MEALLALAGSLGDGLLILLPVLFYVGGVSCLFGSAFALYQRGRGSTSVACSLPVCLALATAGATFLTFDEFLNMGNATLGVSTRVGVGGVNSAGQTTFSESALKSAITQGPLATLNAFIQLFHSFFQAYGALWIYVSIQRLLGSQRGRNNTSFSVNIAMIFAGFGVMDLNKLVPALSAVAQSFSKS